MVFSLLGCGRTTGPMEALNNSVALSDATPNDTTVTEVTASRDPSDDSVAILSAFFGLDDALPRLSDRAICEGAAGMDGMPIVLSHEIDIDTMQAGDFRVVTHSGTIGDITCVTPAPADDPGEARTILIVGQYGSASDEPARVEVVGNVLSKDHRVNFRGTQASVIPLEEGPTLTLAEVVPQEAWDLGSPATQVPFGGGDGCPVGTVQVVRAVWAGGVTKPGGAEIDDQERLKYRVTLRGTDGEENDIVPFAIGDLGDGDNNHELCLDQDGEPSGVHFPAGWVTDPREDLNPSTRVPVAR